MDTRCLADAPSAEPGSSTGQRSQETEQPLSSAVRELVAAIDRQNELLGQIVAQNADMLAMLVQEDDEPEEFGFDLSGKPLSG